MRAQIETALSAAVDSRLLIRDWFSEHNFCPLGNYISVCHVTLVNQIMLNGDTNETLQFLFQMSESLT